MGRIKLSVVIPTYNSYKLIARCLESLEKQTAAPSSFEVIVIDDGSDDNTPEFLKKYLSTTALQLRIIHADHGGPGSARNHGIREASSEWIAFLDSDTLASETWVERGLELIQTYPNAGGFEGRTDIGERHNVTPFTHQTKNKQGGKYPTCNLILKKDLCLFYPEYKIAFREDTDLAFSILEAGYEIIFDADLLACHPPLPPRLARPIKLARRYYYDSLLQRRFPDRYKNDVDVHYIFNMRIPHLRRKIYSLFVSSQVGFVATLFTPYQALIIGGILLQFLSYALVLRVHIHNVPFKRLKFHELLLMSGISLVVPWILLIQKCRGDIAFRREPKFSREKWMLSIKKMQLQHQQGNSVVSVHPPLEGNNDSAPFPLSYNA